MKKQFFINLSLTQIVLIILIPHLLADTVFTQIPGIKENQINCIKIDQQSPDTLYIGTSGALYMIKDGGLNWQKIPNIKTAINTIEIDKNGSVFIASQEGLYLNSRGTVKKIFGGLDISENNVTCVGLSYPNNQILAGTNSGLFNSNDNGKTWHKASNLGNDRITALAIDEGSKNIIYIANSKGLFKTDDSLDSFERLFVITQEEQVEQESPEDSESVEYEELISGSNLINSILILDKPDKNIYLATQKGIYISKDVKNWQRFNEQGLLSKNIRDIKLDSGGNLYAATNKGVYIYVQDNQWKDIYKGISALDIKDIEIDQDKDIWVATSHGLFRGKLNDGDKSIHTDNYPNDEPTIAQVHKAAIDYAEVHPDKIKSWRTAAAKKALLPRVTVGADRYATELYHWDSGANPDVLVKGRDAISWDISLSWDLGDLIWNSYQKDIDVRSRLMVQLRNDILDEITRVYFERRRLQLELLNSPPKSRETKNEKELRLQELTAYLDGLTGDYFSRCVEEKQKSKDNNYRNRQDAKGR